jgi:hypothetical protein
MAVNGHTTMSTVHRGGLHFCITWAVVYGFTLCTCTRRCAAANVATVLCHNNSIVPQTSDSAVKANRQDSSQQCMGVRSG